MCAKNKINFALAGTLVFLVSFVASCSRKTSREVIGVAPVALETPKPPSTAPGLPEDPDQREAVPRFDGGRPESIAIPAIESRGTGKFPDVFSELSGLEAVPCPEVKP
ncbi:MAG: hypothetical protein RJB13_470 [Pseudomonadota bacterium]|jgi:hypothetical protein